MFTTRKAKRHKKQQDDKRSSVVHLRAKPIIVFEEGVVIGQEGVIGGLEAVEVSFELLGLPAGAPVLEPDGHLPRLQPKLLSQLALALRLQLVLCLKALLQQVHLL